MSSVICLRHPRYDGTSSPVLSCKTCCALFVATIRQGQPHPQAQSSQDERAWLEAKRREAQEALRQAPRGQATAMVDFDPSTI